MLPRASAKEKGIEEKGIEEKKPRSGTGVESYGTADFDSIVGNAGCYPYCISSDSDLCSRGCWFGSGVLYGLALDLDCELIRRGGTVDFRGHTFWSGSCGGLKGGYQNDA